MHPSMLNIKIKCWQNILDSPLTWRQRSIAHDRLSDLYHERYYFRTKIIKRQLFDLEVSNGTWYLAEDL